MPVWPIWRAYGIQPESTAARVAPTAPPSASASSSTMRKPSGPADAAAAGDDDTRLLERGFRARFGDALDDFTAGTRSSPLAGAVVTSPALAAGAAVTAFGRTVTMPRPR